MRRLLAGVATVLLVGGCAAILPTPDRGDVLRRVVPSTVQLRAERSGGSRWSGSGVVVASDASARRTWILTTRHFVGSTARQQVYVTAPGTPGRFQGVLTALSEESDLALIMVEGIVLSPVTIKDTTRLGDEVWVVGFPWGRRLTVVSGIVSQIASGDGEVALEGSARMVDASVSYGTSGGGVFDATTGALLAIVEGYRTARVTLDTTQAKVVDIPVPGETTVIAAVAIRHFLLAVGIEPH